MRETLLSEIPYENRYFVFAPFQVPAQVHLVIVGVVRVRSSFQTALAYDNVAVYPQPVFAVHGDAGLGLRRSLVQIHILTESHPDIGTGDFSGRNPLALNIFGLRKYT